MVDSHGRLFEPPARNSMWRFGFPTYPNYEDSELFCGGIKVILLDGDLRGYQFLSSLSRSNGKITEESAVYVEMLTMESAVMKLVA